MREESRVEKAWAALIPIREELEAATARRLEAQSGDGNEFLGALRAEHARLKEYLVCLLMLNREVATEAVKVSAHLAARAVVKGGKGGKKK